MFTKLPLFFSLTIGSLLAFSSFKNASDPSVLPIKESSDDTRRVVINHEYSLEISNSLTENNTLNTDASLQYSDESREVYIIVIDESKTEFVSVFKEAKKYDDSKSVEKNYRIVQMKSLSKGIKKKGKVVISSQKIDACESEIVNFVGKVKGIKSKIFYKIGFITSDEKCYMIMAWTLASNKDKNNEELEKMIKSFRLEN